MISNTNGNKSLNHLLNLSECSGLNLAGSESCREVFGFGGSLVSNKGDPEVIIIVKFKNNVNLSGIMIESSMEMEKRPSSLQIFANKSSIGFGDIGSVTPTENINLSESSYGKIQSLKIAKFKNVAVLCVRIFLFSFI
jgi:hypothetical protein